LKLDDAASNLLLCRDFLLTDQIKSEVLASISAEKAQNGGQVVKVLSENTADAFMLMRAEARRAVNFHTIETFIDGIEKLNPAQRAWMLRKLGWVVPCVMTSADKIDMTSAASGPLLVTLPKDVLRMIVAMLPNESLGSLALANGNFLELSSAWMAVRLQPIRERILKEYHGKNLYSRPDLMFCPLSYMILNAERIKSGKGTLEQLLGQELSNARLSKTDVPGIAVICMTVAEEDRENLGLILKHLYLVSDASAKIDGTYEEDSSDGEDGGCVIA